MQIACGSGWSAAVTAGGSLYMWGQGDGGWLGIPPPLDMPVLGEGEAPFSMPPRDNIALKSVPVGVIYDEIDTGEEMQVRHSCSFDSSHNILVPVRVNKYLISPNYVVERIRCGGSHTIVFLGQKVGGDAVADESDSSLTTATRHTYSTYTNSNGDKKSDLKGNGVNADTPHNSNTSIGKKTPTKSLT